MYPSIRLMWGHLDKLEVAEDVFLGRFKGCRQREQLGRLEAILDVLVNMLVIDFCILPFGFLRHV